MTPEEKKQFLDVLSDPTADVGVHYEVERGAVTITVHRGEHVYGSAMFPPDPTLGMSRALRAGVIMMIFPEEMARAQAMLAMGEMKLEIGGQPATSEEFGAAMAAEKERNKQ